MKFRELTIEDAFEVTPQLHGDPRGLFTEWYRFDRLAEVVGHPLRLAQANLSVSARGVVRGIHFADVPPGQAKYVTCVRGAVLDVLVDLRVGSPTFGRWEGVRLDDTDRRAVYIPEGIGHGFCALTDDATLSYLCSETFNPAGEHGIHPLDPGLAIEWPAEAPQLSAKDEAAPGLAEALACGLLPDYRVCKAYTGSL
ncbi:dTDP-4-dehydrorhamnose 3,5-epimerase [Saccharothrix sp. ST-888]|uniref:dTDP-4-dehydrorhamnose 3,5-epimerase n=1 Tax=Saccharothrix sp. ST-888 TaxID=1427391 RepID=UPI0005ED3BEA|nr:dTDP-4-dehydrorhamnose 3,5-epimerase [Saccharothrix sp. ST-888]KJK56736.1 dTDP-4-dehydrorhamnose 3,5-epimerase [Saccharothrix sp. ST-888]